MDPRGPSRETDSHFLPKNISGYEPLSPIRRAIRNPTVLQLRQILGNLKYPVPKRSGTQSRPCKRVMLEVKLTSRISSLRRLCLRLLKDHVPLASVLPRPLPSRLRRRNNLIRRRYEPARCGLCEHHVLELAPLGLFEIVPVFWRTYTKSEGLIWERLCMMTTVVLAHAPAPDTFEDEDSGRPFICKTPPQLIS